MQILIVNIHIKPDRIEAFKQATMENARNSRLEPGVARFDFLQQSDDASRFVLIEVYRDQAAVAAHKETAHYQTWLAAVDGVFAEPRARALYTNVSPGDREL